MTHRNTCSKSVYHPSADCDCDARHRVPAVTDERAAILGCTGPGEAFGADRDAVIDSLPHQWIPIQRCTSIDAVQAGGAA
jgi:hypothetical protein